MQEEEYRVSGRVLDQRTQEGVGGLTVEIWDKDWADVLDPDQVRVAGNDLIDTVGTDANGIFRSTFTAADFADYPGEGGPDLFFRVFDGEDQIATTEREIQWDVTRHETEITIEVEKPPDTAVPAAPRAVTTTAGDRKVTLEWPTVEGADSYNIYWAETSDVTPATGTKIANVSSPHPHPGLENGKTYYYVVTAVNEAGESQPSRRLSATPQSLGEVPPVNQTVVATVEDRTEFLYTGSDPIQKDVEPETIETVRAAVVRGQVKNRVGEPLPDVRIQAQGHPEFGYTTTRSDGMFDLAVNGGGTLTVEYVKEGFLSAQRDVTARWQEYARAPEVGLIPEEAMTSTSVDLTTDEPQVAQGSQNEDDDGLRQPTVLFPAELTAPVSELEVRIAEYTVGPNGPEAMPNRLPPNVAYTYAVELDAVMDEESREAVERANDLDRPFSDIGLTQALDFAVPVVHYVENFLGFPTGGIVPMGYYDSGETSWIPSENGRVIEILRIENGQAVVDVDGSGTPADEAALNELSISEDERRELAEAYEAGQELWRVPVPHFSPWDCNWPFGPRKDATASKSDPNSDDHSENSCKQE